jgi:hypothetical protein
MRTPGLLTFALRSGDLGLVETTAEKLGLVVDAPVHMNRTRPDGVRLSWSILYLRDMELGSAIPFIIDWGTSPHPAQTTPTGCTLKEFWALHPHSRRLAEIYRALGIQVPVYRAARPGFAAVLDTPNGQVVLLGPD